MKKIIRNIFLFILGFVIVGLTGVSYFTGKAVFDGYTNAVSREETIKNSMEYKNDYEDLRNNYDFQRLMIDNPKADHKIPAIYAKKEGNKDVAVLVHGMGGTKETVSPIMKIFLDMGYDVIAYDQRNAGENEAPYNTFGVLESDDTRAVIDYIAPAYKNPYKMGKLILWGESYGGLTSVIAAGRDETNIDYLILECPVSNGFDMIEPVMEDVSKDQGIPLDFLISTGDWYGKAALGYKFADMDGRKWIKNVSIPTLITNSSIDTVTPPYMGEDLFNALGDASKELVTIDDYKHASFPYEARGEYQKVVENFFRLFPEKSLND